jgi:hypothetical protein
MKWPGLPSPTACASRFSQPPGAFIRPEPAGLVSCRIRSWGSALQSFLPLAQPYAVSSAVTLLTFQPSSGSCSTRESASRLSGLGRSRARSSPGPFSLQGLHSPCDASAFAAAPLLWFAPSDASGQTGSTSGCLSQRAWLVSLETANPPGLCDLLVRHACSSITGSWSRLLRRPGYVTAPSTALLRIPALLYLSQTSRTCRSHLHATRAKGSLLNFRLG